MELDNFIRFEKKDTALILEDGTSFEGFSTAKIDIETFGEVVFNTSMVGYPELLSDPSYWDQIVVLTYPHQGNYGVSLSEEESNGPKLKALIVHELTEQPSRTGSDFTTLKNYLEKRKIPLLYGFDTRAMTLHLRKKGVLRGVITPVSQKNSKPYIFQKERDLILEVTTKEPYYFEKKYKDTVVAIDFGVKRSLLKEIADKGFNVVVLPAQSSAEEVMKYSPKGVFLSNGPGNPELATYGIETVKKLLGKVPIFGVCMGHQVLALALGAKTYKLKFGHRGINQPVQKMKDLSVEISSHNHGYAVDDRTLPKEAFVTHRCLNDEVCEGIEAPSLKAFSVQYHPEAAPGPNDSKYLFDQFCSMMPK